MADKIDMYKLKDMLKKAGATFNALGPLVGVEHEVDKAVYMEIGFFLMYLASSDGEISWDEARFISEIIGLELTPSKIAEIIKEKNIYSTEFESTPPMNFSILVGLEKQYGEQFYPEVVPTEIMLSVYRTIGQAFIVTTDGADAAIDDFQTFISMLENYRDRELRDTPIDESPVRVPPKNTGTQNPPKNGITAPRKG